MSDAALPLAVSIAIVFFTYWCVDIVSPALPTIQKTLALSSTGAGLVFSVFFAGRLLSNLPAAWLVERAGLKWTALTGAAALTIGSLIAALSPSEMVLLPARSIQGVGVAFLAVSALMSVLRSLPGGGAAMTAFNVSMGIGTSGGLLAGGYLTAEMGWPAIFWLSAGIGALLVALCLLAPPQRRQPRTVSASAYDEQVSISPAPIRESAAIAANFLVFANYSIWIVGLPLLGSRKFGFDPGQVGVMLFFVNFVHLVAAIPIGRVIRRAGSQRALTFGFGCGAIGLLLATFAPSPLWLVPPVVLYAVGQVAGNSSAGDVILRLGGGGGRAVGAVRLSSDVGLVAGPVVAGALADIASVNAPFFAFGAMGVVAMLAIMVGGRVFARPPVTS
jgi:MFS family permease